MQKTTLTRETRVHTLYKVQDSFLMAITFLISQSEKLMNHARLIHLKQLCASPYADVICYPRLVQEELDERLEELKQLQIKAIEFVGEKSVRNVSVLGKGCVGIVVKAFAACGVVALKIRRVDADRAEMKHEADMLKIANALNVGPKLLNVSKNFLVMEHVEGIFFQEWLKKVGGKLNKQRIRSVLRQVLEQCWRLDRAGLDHGELSHAPKHIIIKEDDMPYIIDFETASTTRKASNVTSICQYFFIADGLAKCIEEKLGSSIEKDGLKRVLRSYKEARTRESFENVLKTVKLMW